MMEQQQLDAAMNANIEANNEHLTEDKVMQIAIKQSRSNSIHQLTQDQLNSKMPALPNNTPVDNGISNLDDDTPMIIVSTREHVAKSRRENRKTMSKKERKRHTKVVDALSRPRNNTFVNELKGVKDLPSPDRAQELMEFAEDMEED